MLDPESFDVVEAEGGLTTIPLDRLMLSGLNVRQTERDADIAALADDIAARGLKQNLVVIPAHFMTGESKSTAEGGKGWQGLFEVIAGGRRFQALSLLAQDGRLPADHPVPCLIESREEARETSLSENLHRVAMNPADEFDAFAAIVGQNGGGDDAVALCARRFGKTVKYVEGRLRLAALAPDILEALRTNTIGMEAAKAYACTADQANQLKVFQQNVKDKWRGHDPRAIRDALRGRTCPMDDARVLFVTLDTYREKGGRTEVEMFMGTDGEERIVDVSLLDKLVAEKAEGLLAGQAKADGFKQGLFAKGRPHSGQWPKPPAGFEKAWDYGGTISKAQKKKSIGVYGLAPGGAGLELFGRYKPAEKREEYRYTPPTPEEIAAERRGQGIARIAARLAVGPFAGSPFEGRAYWPSTRWVDPVEQINDEEVLVAVLVKVSAADIEAQQDAAAKKYDEDLAAEEEERARKAAEVAAQQGDDLDDVTAELDAMDEDEVAE